MLRVGPLCTVVPFVDHTVEWKINLIFDIKFSTWEGGKKTEWFVIDVLINS